MSDKATVLRANAEFYAAFAAADLDRMIRCWSHSDASLCVHPGWEILEGWESVRESWRAIFAGLAFAQFHASDLHVQVIGDMAWVTCIENLMMVSNDMTSHSRIAATNIFQRIGGSWLVVLHHGSAISHSIEEPGDEELEN